MSGTSLYLVHCSVRQVHFQLFFNGRRCKFTPSHPDFADLIFFFFLAPLLHCMTSRRHYQAWLPGCVSALFFPGAYWSKKCHSDRCTLLGASSLNSHAMTQTSSPSLISRLIGQPSQSGETSGLGLANDSKSPEKAVSKNSMASIMCVVQPCSALSYVSHLFLS